MVLSKEGEKHKQAGKKRANDAELVDNPPKKVKLFDPYGFKSALSTDSGAFPALRDFINSARDTLEKEDDREELEDVVDLYLSISGECKEILLLVESDEKRTGAEIQTVFEALGAILLRITDWLPHHRQTGVHITQALLQNAKRFIYNSLRNTCTARQIKTTLKLLTAAVAVDLAAARELQTHFDFSYEGLAGIAGWKSHSTKSNEDDVRICFVRFVISFLLCGDEKIIQKTLEAKGFVNLLFREISSDKASVVFLILTTLQDKVIKNPNMSRTMKMHLFGERTLQNLSSIYNWNGLWDLPPEQDQGTVRELVHEFLCTLTCSRKFGISFYDKTIGTSGKCQNNILLKFLLSLNNVNGDSLIQELVLNILRNCPDIINKYLSGCHLTFAPRASDYWLKNVDFLSKIYQLHSGKPPAFRVEDRVSVNQLVSMMMVTVVPNVLNRQTLSNGMKNQNVVCLRTMQLVSLSLRGALDAISYSQSGCLGQYNEQELERFVQNFRESLFKLLPSIDFIILQWNKIVWGKIKGKVPQSGGDPTDETETADPTVTQELSKEQKQKNLAGFETTKEELVTGFLELMSLYQQALPDQFASSRYDFTQLLFSICDQQMEDTESQQQLFVFKILLDSPPGKFKWFKVVKDEGSAMSSLLRLYVSLNKSCPLLEKLIVKCLKETGLFAGLGSWEEISLWLHNLAASQAGPGSAVLKLVDQTLLRTKHNPYLYSDRVVEALVAARQHEGGGGGEAPSAGEDQMAAVPLDVSMEVDSATGNESTSDCQENEQLLPCSPLLPVLLDLWMGNTETNNEDVDDFVINVSQDLIHGQFVNPRPVCLLIYNSLKDSQNPTDASVELLHYAKTWLPPSLLEQSQTKEGDKKSRLKSQLGSVSRELAADPPRPSCLLSLYYLGQEKSSKVQKRLGPALAGMGSFRMSRCAQQLLLYMQTAGDLQQSDRVKVYLDLLCQLVEPKIEGAGPGSGGGLSDGKGRGEDHWLHSTFLSILSHPAFLRLVSSPQAENDHSATAVNLLLKITQALAAEKGREVLRPYIAALVDSFSGNFRKLAAAKKGKSGSKKRLDEVKASVATLTHFVDYCSAGDLSGIVSQLLTLPQKSLANSPGQLTDLGASLALLINRSVQAIRMPPRDYSNFLTFVTTASHSTTDAFALKLMQKSLYYVFNTSAGFLHSCFRVTPNQMQIEMVAELIVLSSDCRTWWEQWCKDNAKLISANYTLFLPIVKSYLMHPKSEKGTLNALQKVYVSQLMSDIEKLSADWNQWDSKNDLVACVLVEFLKSTKTEEEIASTLLELTSTENNHVWSRTQFEVSRECLDFSLSKEKEHGDLVGSYVGACLQCLTQLLPSRIEDCLLSAVQNALTKTSIKKISLENGVWKPFVLTALKHGYNSPRILQTLNALIGVIYPLDSRPFLSVKDIYDMLLSHSQFLPTMFHQGQDDELMQTKSSLLELMLKIVRLTPASCQTNHCAAFLGAYQPTLSRPNQLLFQLMQFYESQGARLVQFRPYMWGPAAVDYYVRKRSKQLLLWQQAGLGQLLALLDAEKMERSMLNFPLHRKLEPKHLDDEICDVYDPAFLLPLFCSLLIPECEVDCKKFIECNALGFVLAGLSSCCNRLRQAAYTALASFHQQLEAARLPGKRQFLYLLTCLKNSVKEAASRLPCFLTVYLGRACQVLTAPEHPMFHMTQRYLLMKPQLSLENLPQLQRLLFSSDSQHKTQRSWMLNLLVEGLRDGRDFYVYEKKSFVFKLVLTMADSDVANHEFQTMALKLVELGCKTPAGASALLGTGIVTWLSGYTQRDCPPSVTVSIIHCLESLYPAGKVENALVALANLSLRLLPYIRNLRDGPAFVVYLSTLHNILENIDQSAYSLLVPSDVITLIQQWTLIFGDFPKPIEDGSKEAEFYSRNFKPRVNHLSHHSLLNIFKLATLVTQFGENAKDSNFLVRWTITKLGFLKCSGTNLAEPVLAWLASMVGARLSVREYLAGEVSLLDALLDSCKQELVVGHNQAVPSHCRKIFDCLAQLPSCRVSLPVYVEIAGEVSKQLQR